MKLKYRQRYVRRDGQVTGRLCLVTNSNINKGSYPFWDPKFKTAYATGGEHLLYKSNQPEDLVRLFRPKLSGKTHKIKTLRERSRSYAQKMRDGCKQRSHSIDELEIYMSIAWRAGYKAGKRK